LNWWSSRIRNFDWDDDRQQSGQYIFRPITGQFTPNIYSQFSHGKKSHGQNDAKMDFYFEKENTVTKEIE